MLAGCAGQKRAGSITSQGADDYTLRTGYTYGTANAQLPTCTMQRQQDGARAWESGADPDFLNGS